MYTQSKGRASRKRNVRGQTARGQQISSLLTRANGRQRCVFSLDLLMQTMCDVTEKLVLLHHCGRISNTCRDLTSALPLLSCFGTCPNSPFFSFLLCFFSPSNDLTRPDRNSCCHAAAWTVRVCVGHPELSPASSHYANCKPAGTDSRPAFRLRPGAQVVRPCLCSSRRCAFILNAAVA